MSTPIAKDRAITRPARWRVEMKKAARLDRKKRERARRR